MFTLENTYEEIINTEPLGRALCNFFPACWRERIPAQHTGYTMGHIMEEDTMDWGVPFLSEAFLECANLLMDIAENNRFCFIPLWSSQEPSCPSPSGMARDASFSRPHWKNGIPDADVNDEGCVWLLTGNPSVDNFAFAHTAGAGSVPPYESHAIPEEKRNQTGKRPAVIICPGGGYEMLSTYSEGIQLAQRMERDGGYKAFVLNYRIAPNAYPLPQMDLALAIMHVRAHAGEYGIEPDQVLIIGSSAGGHLCASEACLYEELKKHVTDRLTNIGASSSVSSVYQNISVRPDGIGLLYPVISFLSDYHEGSYLNLTNNKDGLRELLSVEQHITPDYPPTYAFTNADDGCVPPNNTARLKQALEKAGVMHLCSTYPTGDHGVGLGYDLSCNGWSEEMLKFFGQLW